MTAFDHVIVGSGINSLCCAALLAKAGKRVCVLERNEVLGGCIRTDELTLPGFRHDVMSGFHPLFLTSATYAEIADDLHRHGLEYVNTDKPTAVVTSDISAMLLYADRQRNVDAFNSSTLGDGDQYLSAMQAMQRDAELTFALLGNELLSLATGKAVLRYWWQHGFKGLRAFLGDAMASSRRWLESNFADQSVHALLAPWVLHTGLGPDASFSAAMNRLITFTLEQAGMPIVKGGSDKLVDAFQALIEEHGGQLFCAKDVVEVEVQNGVATGVRCADGSRFLARHAVVCNVTPAVLYGQLLKGVRVPALLREQAQAYRFGRADMQIHLAVDGPVYWADSKLNDVAMIHIADSIDSVALAVNEAERGLLPAKATIVVGQPTVLDPSRAPAGKHILWIQLQELPTKVLGDACGEIDVPVDGRWTDTLKEAYAKRILTRLETYIPGLSKQVLGTSIVSPNELEAMNCNLVGGDPYSGHCGIDQFFLWRPVSAQTNHRTSVKGLYHIGASTHPGPGLGGGSGYLVAKSLC